MALTEEDKRNNVVSLAFGGDADRLDAFCREIHDVVPPGTIAILRGSAVTGERWSDHAPFDDDGPGTSDLDLTLVGDGPLLFFKATGFFVPGVHSRPLSDTDPDIAPDLVPLREKLMRIAGRPVNIQASRDIVIQFRGDLLGQPYLTLFEKPEGLSLSGDARRVMFRLLTYNIRRGGVGRAAPIARVIAACRPDVALLQEATRPEVVAEIRERTGMADGRSLPGTSLGFLSREPVEHVSWHRPRLSRHAFIEVVPAGSALRLFGVHLSAVHAAWTERRRQIDIRVAGKRLRNGDPFGRRERIGRASAKCETPGPRGLGRRRQQGRAILDQHAVSLVRPVPFEHGEFGMVRRRPLAIAPHMSEAGDPPFASRQQFLHREFRRGVEVARLGGPILPDHLGGKGVQMRLVARRPLQPRRIDHHEVMLAQIPPDRCLDPVAR